MLTIDTTTQLVITGSLVPLVVALLTKLHAAPWLKAVVNGLLAAVVGAIAVVVQAPDHMQRWQDFVVAIALAWVVSTASYFGLYKPTTVEAKVQTKVPGGIG